MATFWINNNDITSQFRFMLIINLSGWNDSNIFRRFFDTRETPEHFVSKIPKPVNRRLSRTPDVKREKQTAMKERSLTTTKKPRKVKIDAVKTETDDTEKTFSQLRMANRSQRRGFVTQKPNVSCWKRGCIPVPSVSVGRWWLVIQNYVYFLSSLLMSKREVTRFERL